MLVKLARDWFDANGVYHQVRDGLAELPDNYDLGKEEKDKDGKVIGYQNLPPNAVIMSKTATLPSPSVPAKPGFQAKPDNEQLLDLIPFAAPLDQVIRTDNSHVTEDDKKKVEEMAELVAEATQPGNAAQTPAEKVVAEVSQNTPGKPATPARTAQAAKAADKRDDKDD